MTREMKLKRFILRMFSPGAICIFLETIRLIVDFFNVFVFFFKNQQTLNIFFLEYDLNGDFFQMLFSRTFALVNVDF